jgi:hypothetical protein
MSGFLSGRGSSSYSRAADLPAASDPDGAGTKDGAEHRRERRHSASGPVVIQFGYPQTREVHGLLIDLSASGFRMSHACNTLETGQTVVFSHREAHGNARVVWNRIVGELVETGFFVIRS